MTHSEQLIKEIMEQTDSTEEEVVAAMEEVKRKRAAGDELESPWRGAFDNMFGGNDYPHYLPAEHVRKYTIRVTQKYIEPKIWRRIEVPSNTSLRLLADLIISVMGWTNTHLNHFRKGFDTYYVPSHQRELDEENDVVMHYNQETFSVEDVLSAPGRQIFLEYDFCDGWELEVKLSYVKEYAEGEPRKVRFLAGERACPPEDCGGVVGYEKMCKRKSYDPEYLDLDYCKRVAEAFNEKLTV